MMRGERSSAEAEEMEELAFCVDNCCHGGGSNDCDF